MHGRIMGCMPAAFLRSHAERMKTRFKMRTSRIDVQLARIFGNGDLR